MFGDGASKILRIDMGVGEGASLKSFRIFWNQLFIKCNHDCVDPVSSVSGVLILPSIHATFAPMLWILYISGLSSLPIILHPHKQNAYEYYLSHH